MNWTTEAYFLDDFEDAEEFDEFDELEKFGNVLEIEEIPFEEVMTTLDDVEEEE